MESPIPMPTADPVQVRTAQDVGLQPPPQVPAVYYGSEAGGIAHVADKVLTGWMAGKKIKEDKMRQTAAETIGAAKSAVDVVGQSYRTAVESGDQEKIASTQKALKAAWENYVGKAEMYVQPPEDQQKGVKNKLKKALLPNSPQIYQQATLDILKQTDPTSMYGPSKKEKLQQQAAEGQIAEQGTRQKIDQMTLDEQTKIHAATNDYVNAVTNGDTTAQQKASQTLQAYGRKVELPSEQQLRQQVTQNALEGMKALKDGKDWAQISDLQRAAMVKEGVAPQEKNAFQAGYLGQVGEGKRFKTAYDAAHQYMLDERTSRVMGMKPTPLEELRASERVMLQHDLQDPETAKKYGIAPLKAGQQPPAWLVEQESMKRYKETSEEKSENRIYSDVAINKITTKALNTFSPFEQEVIKAGFLSKDDDSGLYTLNPNPDFNNVPGMNPDQAQQLYGSFRTRAKSWYSELYPNADSATIEKRLGPAPTGAASPKASLVPPPRSLNTQRGGSDATGLLPPPTVNTPSYPPTATYTISKGGKSLYGGQAVQMTAAQAAKAADGGFVITQSK